MTNNDPYKKAVNAYQDTNTSAMGGFDVVVELYKGMIKNIRAAKTAQQEGQLEDMVKLIEKTNNILIALQSHIDRKNGGEAAEFLDKFYNGVFATLMRIHREDNPAAAFDTLLGHIQPVYEIWCRHASAASEATSSENKDDNNGSGVEVGV